MKRIILTSLLVVVFCGVSAQAAVLFEDEFDGNGHGYNPNAATAQSGDYDWVDFGNRMTASDISIGIEGYTTASGGTESVLAGASGAEQNDPQIRSDFSIGLPDAYFVTDIVLRVRADLDDNGVFDDTLTEADVDVFFGNFTYVVPGAGNATNAGNQNFDGLTGFTSTLTSEANGWHVFSYSCDQGRLGSIRSLRIDPVNNLPGRSFEVDYILITNGPTGARNPGPFDGEEHVELSEMLTWNKGPLDPNVTGFWVYFSQNANDLDTQVPVFAALAGSGGSYDPTLAQDTTYYWRVDEQRNNLPYGDPGNIKGAVWSFVTVGPAPVVTKFDNVLTARDLLPATLAATITDMDSNVASVVFSCDDPNVILQNQNTDLYAPTIELDLIPGGLEGDYVVTITVTDVHSNVAVDTADVDIFDNACEAAQFASGWHGFSGFDYDKNCKVDLGDLATFAQAWLDNRTLQSQESYE